MQWAAFFLWLVERARRSTLAKIAINDDHDQQLDECKYPSFAASGLPSDNRIIFGPFLRSSVSVRAFRLRLFAWF